MSPTDQQFAEQLGGAVLVWPIKIIGFLIVLAIVRWGLDIGRILKNQRETIELLGQIRDRLAQASTPPDPVTPPAPPVLTAPLASLPEPAPTAGGGGMVLLITTLALLTLAVALWALS
jgi:hypothetical protein